MVAAPDRLGAEARRVLEDPDTDLFLSAASSWELSIKVGIGKLALPEPPARFILDRLVRDGVTPLPVQHHHAVAVADLPLHHRDPFDRLLIAQARTERVTFLTADRLLQAYEVDLLLA
jgi:PIN domain nuclease of toxin-antitoxin system